MVAGGICICRPGHTQIFPFCVTEREWGGKDQNSKRDWTVLLMKLGELNSIKLKCACMLMLPEESMSMLWCVHVWLFVLNGFIYVSGRLVANVLITWYILRLLRRTKYYSIYLLRFYFFYLSSNSGYYLSFEEKKILQTPKIWS